MTFVSLLHSPTSPLSGVSLNTCLIGLAFLCIYSAFNALANTSELMLFSYQANHAKADFGEGTGYSTLMVFNVFFAVGPFTAPFAVRILREKASLVLAGASYVLYVSVFFHPSFLTLHVASAAVGLLTSLLWVAGFNLVTVSCRPEKLELNSTVFWLIAQFSYVFGNGVVFFTFFEVESITDKTRYITIFILTFICCIGVAVFLVTKNPVNTHEKLLDRVKDGFDITINTVVETKILLKDYVIILFTVIFLFTGIFQSFFNGIYGACLGFTNKINHPHHLDRCFNQFQPDAKWLAGVSGIFVGLGQISAALLRLALCHFFKRRNLRSAANSIIVTTIGFVIFNVTFVLIFFYIPNSSPFGETDDESVFKPSKPVAVLCSFLLGSADCLYQTEILHCIGTRFKEATPSAMAMFSLFQAIGGILTFLNSSAEHFELRAQIIIMAILCVVSYFVFIIAALSPKESVSGSGSNSDAKNQNDFIVLDGDNGGCEKKQISGQTESTT